MDAGRWAAGLAPPAILLKRVWVWVRVWVGVGVRAGVRAGVRVSTSAIPDLKVGSRCSNDATSPARRGSYEVKQKMVSMGFGATGVPSKVTAATGQSRNFVAASDASSAPAPHSQALEAAMLEWTKPWAKLTAGRHRADGTTSVLLAWETRRHSAEV